MRTANIRKNAQKVIDSFGSLSKLGAEADASIKVPVTKSLSESSSCLTPRRLIPQPGRQVDLHSSWWRGRARALGSRASVWADPKSVSIPSESQHSDVLAALGAKSPGKQVG